MSKKHLAPIVMASLAAGFYAGRQSVPESSKELAQAQVLPNGLPRTCCEEQTKLTQKQVDLFRTLRRIVGMKNVINGQTDSSSTETAPFVKGARLGKGEALYIVRPQKLKQVLEIVQQVVEADCAVLVQGQNTGLTGGSVPRPCEDGRPTVIVSMKDLNGMFPIDDGQRVVCLAGAGLADLSNFISEHFPNRESHSILGSTFLNPTTSAGIAFGSGGTQLRKGPAFTERALYLKVDTDKFGRSAVKIVNRLGVKGFDTEEGEIDCHLRHDGDVPKLDTYLHYTQNRPDTRPRHSNDTYGKLPASDSGYKEKLCMMDDTVSRYNADTSGCDCNRSEGKVLILATVHDTFPKPMNAKTFWMSFDSLQTTLNFRRQVCLDNANDLPVSMEYMDRDSFDVIDRAGRILGNVISYVGPSSPLVRDLWNVKLWVESLNFKGAPLWMDKLLYAINPIAPAILPKPIMRMGTEKDHHVAITVGDFDGSLDRFLERLEHFQEKNSGKVDLYECSTPSEVGSLTAFRFVAAPAFRTWCVGEGVQGFSVDYALPKSGGVVPALSDSIQKPIKRMRYSHFGCNVVHEDIAFPVGVDIHQAKMQLKKSVEISCNGKLPAEHGHGTEYTAPEATRNRWKQMDPLNVMNPGIGGLSSRFRYKE